MKQFNEFMDVSKDVSEALASGKAVVALESTIISHGFPYPENKECALESEANIRKMGAIPATIAMIGGRIKVGLTEDQIEYLAVNRDIPKASRRDVPVLIALGKDGATTVATTMMFAEMAGIKVFATGGIGGVHRNAQETMDISADLEELANTSVAVVCAGAKSILDIGLTKEYLETNGVPILGYQTEDLGGFYTRQSGFKVDQQVDLAKDIARIIDTKIKLNLRGGMVISNPIPKEYEMDYKFISTITEQALKESVEQGVKGKATTPFLLARIHELTEGKSVVANKQLVFNNARVAAQIAVELTKC